MTLSGGNHGTTALRDDSRIDAKSFVIPKRLIWEAWKRVAANQGSAGVDRESIAVFQNRLARNLYALWNRMSSGSYFPTTRADQAGNRTPDPPIIKRSIRRQPPCEATISSARSTRNPHNRRRSPGRRRWGTVWPRPQRSITMRFSGNTIGSSAGWRTAGCAKAAN